MRLINLTAHPINIVDEAGNEKLTIPASGTVARCAEKIEVIGELNGIPVTKKAFGQVYDLPEPQVETYFIVSLPVALAMAGTRNDLFVPGEVVRIDGKIVGCKSLAVV